MECLCWIVDIGVIPQVDHNFATIIFNKKCPIHRSYSHSTEGVSMGKLHQLIAVEKDAKNKKMRY